MTILKEEELWRTFSFGCLGTSLALLGLGIENWDTKVPILGGGLMAACTLLFGASGWIFSLGQAKTISNNESQISAENSTPITVNINNNSGNTTIKQNNKPI